MVWKQARRLVSEAVDFALKTLAREALSGLSQRTPVRREFSLTPSDEEEPAGEEAEALSFLSASSGDRLEELEVLKDTGSDTDALSNWKVARMPLQTFHSLAVLLSVLVVRCPDLVVLSAVAVPLVKHALGLRRFLCRVTSFISVRLLFEEVSVVCLTQIFV